MLPLYLSGDPLTADDFRRIMRHVPSVVTVVTAAGPDEMRGVTIGSFTSLSLTPPLICFNLSRTSRMFSLLQATAGFAVHVLASQQASLSRRFALPGQSEAEQFDGLAYETANDGTPLLDGVAATLKCRLHRLVDIGEKAIVLGEVQHADVDPYAPALLYYRHNYAGLNGTVQPVDDSGVANALPTAESGS
jgi:flavin reductase (DIM6/NTAB) family NADH-FMN oxidoreductase RutF